MRYELKIILVSILSTFMAIQSYGNTSADSVKVIFRVGNSQFDPSLDNNRQAMDNFISLVRKKCEANEIDSLVVRAYASPEGSNVSNEQLSRLRCENIADFIVKETGIDPQKIRIFPEGEAWKELRRIVADYPDVPSREKILYILDNVPLWIFNSKGAIVDGKKKRLLALDGGKPYHWLSVNVFPLLRNAVAIASFVKPEKDIQEHTQDEPLQPVTSLLSEHNDEPDEPELPDVSDLTEQIDTVCVPIAIKEHRNFYMAVKTNMLYDAVLVPNIAADFYLDKNFSLYGEWMYAWWDNDRGHRYWRVYGGDIGARWWFGKKAHAKPLTGHHLGVYGGILTFDFEAGDTGYLGGKPGGTLWDRCVLNTGIEYGYSLPVAKRLNIDFSIGIGYMGGNYIKYYPFDNDYYFDKEYRMHYWGPTKAEISLVWLIGRGNTNIRKKEVTDEK